MFQTTLRTPMNLSQRQQREWFKEKPSLHETCLLQSALCHLPRNQKQQFQDYIDFRQTSKNVRRGRKAMAGYSSDRFAWFRRPFPCPPHIFIVLDWLSHLLGSPLTWYERCHYIPVIRNMDFGAYSYFFSCDFTPMTKTFCVQFAK